MFCSWKISGIPCKHAIRGIIAANFDPHKFTSTWYSVGVYKRAYDFNINPIPNEEQWPEIDMPTIFATPCEKKGIGRPARNRRRDETEPEKSKRSTIVQCKKCKAFGHNCRTCEGGPIRKEQARGIKVELHKRLKKQHVAKSQPVARSQHMPTSQPMANSQPVPTSDLVA